MNTTDTTAETQTVEELKTVEELQAELYPIVKSSQYGLFFCLDLINELIEAVQASEWARVEAELDQAQKALEQKNRDWLNQVYYGGNLVHALKQAQSELSTLRAQHAALLAALPQLLKEFAEMQRQLSQAAIMTQFDDTFRNDCAEIVKRSKCPDPDKAIAEFLERVAGQDVKEPTQ